MLRASKSHTLEETHPGVPCSGFTSGQNVSWCSQGPLECPVLPGNFIVPTSCKRMLPLLNTRTFTMFYPISLSVHLYLPSRCLLTMCPQTTRRFAHHLPWLTPISSLGSILRYVLAHGYREEAIGKRQHYLWFITVKVCTCSKTWFTVVCIQDKIVSSD